MLEKLGMIAGMYPSGQRIPPVDEAYEQGKKQFKMKSKPRGKSVKKARKKSGRKPKNLDAKGLLKKGFFKPKPEDLPPDLPKPKRKKHMRKPTMSSIKGRVKAIAAVNTFLYNLEPPFTREKVRRKLQEFTREVKQEKGRMKTAKIRLLKNLTRFLDSMQDEAMENWFAEYKKKQIAAAKEGKKVEEMGDIEGEIQRSQEVSSTTDASVLIEEVLTLFTQGVDVSDEEVVNALVLLSQKLQNQERGVLIRHLSENPEMSKAFVEWVAQNAMKKPQEIWLYLEGLVNEDISGNEEFLAGGKKEQFLDWVPPQEREGKHTRRLRTVLDLITVVRDFERSRKSYQDKVISMAKLQKKEKVIGEILRPLGISIEQAIRLINKDNAFFEKIEKLREDTRHGSLPRSEYTSSMVQRENEIIAELEGLDKDLFLLEKPKLIVTRPFHHDSEEEVKKSYRILLEKEEEEKTPESKSESRYFQDFLPIREATLEFEKTGKWEDYQKRNPKSNLSVYEGKVGFWRPRKFPDIEKSKTHREILNTVLSSSAMEEELRSMILVVKGELTDIIDKYVEEGKDYASQVFKGKSVKQFVDSYVKQALNASETFGEFLQYIAELTIFFRLSSWASNNKYALTDITGKIGGRESGELLRSGIVQKLYQPQHLLGLTMQEKLPIFFRSLSTLFPADAPGGPRTVIGRGGDLERERFGRAILQEKNKLLRTVFSYLDPTAKSLSVGIVLPGELQHDVNWHESCQNMDDDRKVMYYETVDGIETIFCFDILKLHDSLTKGHNLNPYTKNRFSGAFINRVLSLDTPSIAEFTEYLKSKKPKTVKQLVKIALEAPNIRNVKYNLDSEWAVASLYDNLIKLSKLSNVRYKHPLDIQSKTKVLKPGALELSKSRWHNARQETLVELKKEDDEESVDDEDSTDDEGGDITDEEEEEFLEFSMSSDSTCSVCQKPLKPPVGCISTFRDPSSGYPEKVTTCASEECFKKLNLRKK